MSLYSIKDTTLTAIGDAIRAKNGSTDTYTSEQMAAAISAITTGGGGSEAEPIVLTGNCEYACAGRNIHRLFDLTSVSTNDITGASSMFFEYGGETIPFALNFMPNAGNIIGTTMFKNATKLKALPAMNNFSSYSMESLFHSCESLIEIPEGLDATWDWDTMHNASYGKMSYMFAYCRGLRKIPSSFLSQLYSLTTSYSNPIYNNGFISCMALDEIKELAVHPTAITSNMFRSFIQNCNHLKALTFAMNEDGTPKTVNWKSQTIDVSGYIGYFQYATYPGLYTDLSADKQVTDLSSYEALKDDPDWWTIDATFSRYNHDSAVETINSLPDVSASGGTNTIKFKGTMGSGYGKAISDLTEDEIAVATAKGWTVSIT